MEVSSHEDSVSIFSMKLLGFVSKAIKLLLTELICQCRNILPIAFLSVGQYGKAAGNIFCTDLPTS